MLAFMATTSSTDSFSTHFIAYATAKSSKNPNLTSNMSTFAISKKPKPCLYLLIPPNTSPYITSSRLLLWIRISSHSALSNTVSALSRKHTFPTTPCKTHFVGPSMKAMKLLLGNLPLLLCGYSTRNKWTSFKTRLCYAPACPIATASTTNHASCTDPSKKVPTPPPVLEQPTPAEKIEEQRTPEKIQNENIPDSWEDLEF